MRLVKNSGNDRVVDELRQCLTPQATLDIASPAFSLFAFGELCEALTGISKARLALPADRAHDLVLLGTAADRPFRNHLHARWLAKQCAEWMEKKAEVRHSAGATPQATLIAGDANGALKRVITALAPSRRRGWASRLEINSA